MASKTFELSFHREDVARVLWTFAQAGLGAAVVVASAQSQIPDTWDGAKQLSYGAGVAFVAAGVSAVKNLFLKDSSKLK